MKRTPLRIGLLILVSTLFPFFVLGQDSKLSEAIINIVEELAADESDPEAASVYIERLFELSENPVRLNSAEEDEISRLFFLSDFQVKVVADYVLSSGRLISIYELANIPGFDQEIAEMMTPFITLDAAIMMKPDSARWRNSIITNISARSGNADTTTLGSSWKILTKYKFNAGTFSGGFTSEKDPGEQFLSGNPPLPDFFSAHVAYSGKGLIRKLILGDYSARFGQGTSINTGIRSALSTTAHGYMSARDEIKPYTSTDENNFFRGLAAEISVKNFGLTLFYSKNYSDATLSSLSDQSEYFVKNFYKSGIHNTSSLLQKKDVVSERMIGANLSYNFNNVRIGFTFAENIFSLPIIPETNDPENYFAFAGTRNNLYTLYFNSLIKRSLLFSEFSINEMHNYAFVQGLSFRPSDRMTINLLYRNYSAGYTSFHGRGPGNNSVTANEHGILGNFSFELAKHLFISAGCDVYTFPWLKYRNSAPSYGLKQEIRVKYIPSEKLVFEAHFNHRVSMADESGAPGIPEQTHIAGNTYKASVRYSLTAKIKSATRVDYKIVDPAGSNGTLLLQDFVYSFSNLPLTLWFRYCIFNTDDWDSRLYTYENDLLYSFSIPSLSGKGSRSYIMAKWEIGEMAEMRFKYGITSLVGSGMSQNNKEEVKIQFRMRF